MRELIGWCLCCGALFLLVSFLADIIILAVGKLLSLSGAENEGDETTLHLENPDTAEMQLRRVLWLLRCRGTDHKVTVLAKYEDCYIIAEKILRKYPNIGLLYQPDLNYNIE